MFRRTRAPVNRRYSSTSGSPSDGGPRAERTRQRHKRHGIGHPGLSTGAAESHPPSPGTKAVVDTQHLESSRFSLRRSSTADSSDRHDLNTSSHRFGIEPICTVLTQHGMQIAPSTYYAYLARPASAADPGAGRPHQHPRDSSPGQLRGPWGPQAVARGPPHPPVLQGHPGQVALVWPLRTRTGNSSPALLSSVTTARAEPVRANTVNRCPIASRTPASGRGRRCRRGRGPGRPVGSSSARRRSPWTDDRREAGPG